MIKNFLLKITGLQKIKEQIEQELEEARAAIIKAKEEEQKAIEAKKLAELSPKELATKKGEPYIDVVQTYVNKENARHAFMEFDWNDIFIKQLIREGFGFESDPEHELVDRWYRSLVYDLMIQEGIDPDRNYGYTDINKIKGV